MQAMPKTVFKRKPEPIQVNENYSGPIPTRIKLPSGNILDGQLHYRFVAYRDAERDANAYGYGGTEEQAIADFVRQEWERRCAICLDCTDSTDCFFSTPSRLAAVVKMEIDHYEANNASYATHNEWRTLNEPEPEEGDF